MQNTHQRFYRFLTGLFLSFVASLSLQAQVNSYQNFDAGYGWTHETQGSGLTLPDGTIVYGSGSTISTSSTNYAVGQYNYGPNEIPSNEVLSYWSTNTSNRPRAELYNPNIVKVWGAYEITFKASFTNTMNETTCQGCFFQLFPELNGQFDRANFLFQFGVSNHTNYSFSAVNCNGWGVINGVTNDHQVLTWNATAAPNAKFSFRVGIYCDGTGSGWITVQYGSGTNYYAFPQYSGSGATLGTINGSNTEAPGNTYGEIIKCGAYSEGDLNCVHDKVAIYSMYIKKTN